MVAHLGSCTPFSKAVVEGAGRWGEMGCGERDSAPFCKGELGPPLPEPKQEVLEMNACAVFFPPGLGSRAGRDAQQCCGEEQRV